MINKIFGINSSESLDLNNIIRKISERNSSLKQRTSNGGNGFFCNNRNGFYEDDEIIILADLMVEDFQPGKIKFPKNCSILFQIACVYKEKKIDLLKYLKGGFALIIWDKINKELFGARDHIGIKNLFYSWSLDMEFIFATQLKDILSVGLIQKDLDKNAIFHYLFIKAFEQPSTPFKNIKSLMPGHFFIQKDGNLTIKKYWDLSFKICNDDERFALDQINKNIKTFLSNNLDIKNKSTGVLLSGGLDSSFLVSLLKKYNHELKTFTIKFGKEGESNNETKYAKIVSDYHGTYHTEVEISAATIKDNLPSLIFNMDTPVANSGYKLLSVLNIPTIKGVENLLSGEGADTLFGLDWRWNRFDILDMIFYPFNVIPLSKRESAYSSLIKISKKLSSLFNSSLLRGLHRYFYTKSGYFKWKGSSIEEDTIRKLFIDKEDLSSIKDLYRKYYNNSNSTIFSNKCTYATIKTYTPNQQLTHSTSLCNNNKIQALFPFLDIDLIQYCVSLPNSLKRKNGINKYLLHQMAKKIVPKKILQRPKDAFKMPFDTWLRNELKPLVDNAFSKETINKRGLFDYHEMKKLYDAFFYNNSIPWVDIWSFVILELWLNKFYDNSEFINKK